MNAKLFLIYLRVRKLLPAISVSWHCVIAFFGLAVTAINQFLNYRHLLAERWGFVNTDPWIVQSVLSGNSLTVVRGDEKLDLRLCGISGGNRDYLQSLINLGNSRIASKKFKD